MEMQQFTVRLPAETHQKLALIATLQKRHMSDIVRELIEERIETDEEFLQIADAIAGARAKLGPVSDEQAAKTAKKAAKLDDNEGLPDRRVSKGRST